MARLARYGLPAAFGDEGAIDPARVPGVVLRLEALAAELGVEVTACARELAGVWVRERPGRDGFLVQNRHPLLRLVEDLDWAAAEYVRRQRARDQRAHRTEAPPEAHGSAAPHDPRAGTRAVLDAVRGRMAR